MLKIIDLYADWCQPCKMQKPIIEEIEAIYTGQIEVIKLNVDIDDKRNVYSTVRSIPTIIYEKDGVILDQIAGLQTKTQIIEKIEKYK